jgi:hypothetical protein
LQAIIIRCNGTPYTTGDTGVTGAIRPVQTTTIPRARRITYCLAECLWPPLCLHALMILWAGRITYWFGGRSQTISASALAVARVVLQVTSALAPADATCFSVSEVTYAHLTIKGHVADAHTVVVS